MSRSGTRRTAVLTVLTPVVAAGLISGAGSASAIPFEGEPTAGFTCLRLERLSDAGQAGSTPFPFQRYVLVLSSDC